MSQQNQTPVITPKTEQSKPKRVITPAATKSALLVVTKHVLASPYFNPTNRAYVERIQAKVLADKRPTENEVAGLFKIERGVNYTAQAEAKARLAAAKPIGGESA